MADTFKDGVEAAARWHDERAKSTPDAFEMEFHQVSAAAIRALLAPEPAGEELGRMVCDALCSSSPVQEDREALERALCCPYPEGCVRENDDCWRGKLPRERKQADAILNDGWRRGR